MKKQVSVIIPNFNGRNYLKDCLNSLNQQHFQDFEIILVDNASTDDSLSLAREFCPEIKTIVLSENFGFCRAVNEGIRASKAPFVLLLNNDTVVDPDFVGALYEAIRGKEKVFSCASQMRKLTDPSKMDDGGDFYFDIGAGELLCGDCAEAQGLAPNLDEGALIALRARDACQIQISPENAEDPPSGEKRGDGTWA